MNNDDLLKQKVAILLQEKDIWERLSDEDLTAYFFRLCGVITHFGGHQALQRVCFGLALDKLVAWERQYEGRGAAYDLLVLMAEWINGDPDSTRYTPNELSILGSRLTAGWYSGNFPESRVICNGGHACFSRPDRKPVRAVICMGQYSQDLDCTVKQIKGILRSWAVNDYDSPAKFLEEHLSLLGK